MHFPTIIAIQYLAVAAMAIYPFKGSNYGLLMSPLAPGAEVAKDIYDNCKKLDEAGNVVSQGEDCVVYVIQYMVDALIRFWPGEDEAVMVRQSLTIGLPSAEGTGIPQPGAKHESRATDERQVRAVELSHSEMHHKNGISIRTNIYGGDRTLHVHTNSSHATAVFEKDTSSSANQRNAIFARDQYRITFEGTMGFKIQLQRRGEAISYFHELYDLFESFARKEGERAPRFKESDSWAFAVCGNADNALVVQGKLVSLDDGAGDNFESNGLIDCKEGPKLLQG